MTIVSVMANAASLQARRLSAQERKAALEAKTRREVGRRVERRFVDRLRRGSVEG